MHIFPRLHVSPLFPVMMLCALIPGIANANFPHSWVKSLGNTGSDAALCVTVDGSNTIVAGEFSGSVDFGGGELMSAGQTDIFIAKYDSDGVHVSSRRIGGTGSDLPQGVHLDGASNMIVAGSFQTSVDFGGGALMSAGGDDIFVVKYDPSGAHIWSKRFGSSGFDRAHSLAKDGSNNVIVVGQFEGTVDFGGGGLVSVGTREMFVAKYDASGNHMWSKRFGSSQNDVALGVAVDGADNVVVTGSFAGGGPVSFGGSSFTSAGQGDMFIAKFDPNGDHIWSLAAGGPGFDFGIGLAVDVSGNILVTGEFENTVNFGGGELASAGLIDIFIAKYDASGGHVWSRRFGGTGVDRGFDIDIDGDGNTLATGHFSDVTIDLGGRPITNGGGSDIWLASYDADGAHLWSRGYGSSGSDYGYECAWLSNSVVVVGFYEETVDFEGKSLTAVGLSDAFVLNLDRPPVSVVGQIPTSLALQIPNPVRGGPVQMRISLPVAASASLEIVAVTGQKVWSSRLGGSPGVHSVTWDGRGKNATLAEPGVYFARLLTPLGARTVRFVVLR